MCGTSGLTGSCLFFIGSHTIAFGFLSSNSLGSLLHSFSHFNNFFYDSLGNLFLSLGGYVNCLSNLLRYSLCLAICICRSLLFSNITLSTGLLNCLLLPLLTWTTRTKMQSISWLD